MDYKLLIDTAALAGTIMLRNGAEIYRVEDTIGYILSVSGLETVQAFVVSTGLMISLDDPKIDALTVVRRVNSNGTNLNAITKVNEISRQFYLGKMSLEDAFHQLEHLNMNQYPWWMKSVALILVGAFFTGMLGGNVQDMLMAGVLGAVLATWQCVAKGIELNGIIGDLIGSMFMSLFASWFVRIPGINLHLDLLIIGSIMALVPGAAITNAIRDTLHGDYAAGGAKILEAFVKAAMIALGVYCGFLAARLV